MPELVSYPDSSVAFICGPQVKVGAHPLFDAIAIVKGAQLGEWSPAVSPRTSPAADEYFRANYYDLALCLYINYYRTGDPMFLGYARKAADAWWESQWIESGTMLSGDRHHNPRDAAYAGLMLRALDGRPELWDYLEREIRGMYNAWVIPFVGRSDIVTAQKLPTWHDMREIGYCQLYAVMMAKVLLDSYPLFRNGTLQPTTGTATDGAAKRAQYLSQAESTAVDYFAKLQRADGSWRNDVPGEGRVNVEQPFMTGLYHEAISRLYDLTTKETVKTSLRTQLTRSLDHLYNHGYDNSVVTNFPPNCHRAMFYYVGGGTTGNPLVYEWPTARGSAPDLRFGDGSPPVNRLQNSTVLHSFGKAYAITGDSKYLSMGKELFGACFGDERDQLKSIAGTAGGKEYCMFMRAGGQWLALTAGTPVPPPPPPVEEPPPIPVPTPPTPCTISGPDSISVRRNSEGSINIALNNLSAAATVNVEGSSGQVSVTPLSRIVSPTAGIAAFRVKVKSQSRTITFNSPCGSKSVRVNVT